VPKTIGYQIPDFKENLRLFSRRFGLKGVIFDMEFSLLRMALQQVGIFEKRGKIWIGYWSFNGKGRSVGDPYVSHG
jgi:hypothetical protein